MKNLINKSLVLAAAAFIAVGCETSEIPTFGEGNIEDLGVSVENLNAIRFPGIGGVGENGELVENFENVPLATTKLRDIILKKLPEEIEYTGDKGISLIFL